MYYITIDGLYWNMIFAYEILGLLDQFQIKKTWVTVDFSGR